MEAVDLGSGKTVHTECLPVDECVTCRLADQVSSAFGGWTKAREAFVGELHLAECEDRATRYDWQASPYKILGTPSSSNHVRSVDDAVTLPVGRHHSCVERVEGPLDRFSHRTRHPVIETYAGSPSAQG